MFNLEPKQVVVVRTKYVREDGSTYTITDKKLFGKLAAQASHAVLDVFLDRRYRFFERFGLFVIPATKPMVDWCNQGFAKVVVKVESEEELLAVYNKAKGMKLPCSLIRDEGRTKFHGQPTYTCAAIGPAVADFVDEVTGQLKLL